MAGSAGTPRAEVCHCCLLSLSAAGPLRTMAGSVPRLRVALAGPPAGPYLRGEGALQGPHCLGPINSGNPGAEWKEVSKVSSPGLLGCAAGSHGTAAGQRSWKAP